MGLLFAKKKKDLAEEPPIRKSRAGSVPKRVVSNQALGQPRPPAAQNSTGNSTAYNDSKGLTTGLASNFKMVAGPAGNITGFSSPNSSNSSTQTQTSAGAFDANSGTPSAAPPESYTPLQRVVNVYGFSLSLFKVTRAIASFTDLNDPNFFPTLDAVIGDLSREVAVILDHNRLKDWVQPIHYRKTGTVIGAGKRIQSSYQEFYKLYQKLKPGPINASDYRQLKECLKELLRTFLSFLNGVEMVVPSDFSTEINELARTLRDVVDTASAKLNYVFDDVARICCTYSIRLARLGTWKSLQVENIAWSRAVNDTCFTISKATKVLYIVGLKLYDNPSDQNTYQNLSTLTKGVVTQMKKLQTHIQTDPPQQKNAIITFTPEVIQEHIIAYDQGIKELSNSLAAFTRNNSDASVVENINKIIKQLEIIKNTVKSPDNSSLVSAVGHICDSLEKFCGAVYYALYEVSEDNEVIKEQIMETMQYALHCAIQLQLVACTKSLQFTIINPEATMLTCLRSLLLSVSIVTDAVDYMKAMKIVPSDDSLPMGNLGNAEVHAALVYVLHYGRALFKGDEGDFEFEIPSSGNENQVADLIQEFPPTPRTEDDKSFRSLVASNGGGSLVSGNSPPAAAPPTTTTTTSTTTSVNTPPAVSATSSASGTANRIKVAGLEFTEEELLKMNPDSFSPDNLPPGFEPPPARPVYKTGSSEEEYKKYMIAKYEYETWENKLILCKIKLKKQCEEIKAKKG